MHDALVKRVKTLGAGLAAVKKALGDPAAEG